VDILSPTTLRMIIPLQRQYHRAILFIPLVVAVVTLAFAELHGTAHFRAIMLLLRIQNPQNPGILGRATADPVEQSMTEVPTASGSIRARLYIPKDRPNSPGMVIVHGVHHLGIDEPRLVAFARGMSSSGFRVLTPELASLADYRVDRASVAAIGYSAKMLSTSVGRRVGVLGLSFAGGLALMAAADPKFDPYVGFVVSVGAHDDLERVSRFLITDRIKRPDGTILGMAAHEYGALVLIYSHVEDFFPAADFQVAREALRLLLWERVEESRKRAQQLSPDSRQRMELLFEHHQDALAGVIEKAISLHQTEMADVSPHGQLGSLQAPVLLLHGAGDNVIPPSELLWLQQDVPPRVLRAALISPAISHVEVGGKPALTDELRLVHFMAQIFELTDAAEPVSSSVRN
jgi:pimeloyl-ACP methyl ester carboxylesterase